MKIFMKIIRWGIFLSVIATIIAIIVLFFIFKETYDEGLDLSSVKIEEASIIYDSSGNQITSIYNDKFYTYVYLGELPKYVTDAFIAIEDKRFYDHEGVDLKRTTSAALGYIFDTNMFGNGGGSTITQQLVKNITKETDYTPERKLTEISRAIWLEDNMTKQEILETYLNYIYFGNGAYGINAASQVLFAKNASEITLAEAAILASLPKAPEGYNPYTSEENKEELLNRKDLVLSLMYEQNLITSQEYELAKDEEIKFQSFYDTSTTMYTRYIVNETVCILIDLGIVETEEEAYELIYVQGGLEIYSNLDKNLQEQCYNIIKEYYTDEDLETGFVLSTTDGRVVAAVGSRTLSGYDRANTMLRQPGSSIKPLAVYAPAFDIGIITPYSTMIDERITIGDWSPKNWYNSYLGEVSIRYAVANSINTIAAKLMYDIGINQSVNYLESFGITSLVESDYNYPLALGGMTYGVSVFEMTQAYNTFANEGEFTAISYINEIYLDGKCIYSLDDYQNAMSEKIISKEASDMVNNVLEYVVTSTGYAHIDGYTSRGKTGTTNDVKDYWYVGYTEEYVAGIWTGYDDNKSMDFSSREVIGLWTKLLKEVH